MKQKSTVTKRKKDGRLVYELSYSVESNHPNEYSGEVRDAQGMIDVTPKPRVGSFYIPVTVSNTMARDEDTRDHLSWVRLDNVPDGISGNMNPDIKRFHGWRGTTNDIARYAEGVRKCESVKVTGKYSKKLRIVFGPDLYPDRD